MDHGQLFVISTTPRDTVRSGVEEQHYSQNHFMCLVMFAGDEINNQKSFDLIGSDLIARHEAYDRLIREQGCDFTPAELNAKDERIHCCLYFIAPHRMKLLDVQFIEKLREHVVVVPVIAKADTMTNSERYSSLYFILCVLTRILQG